MQQKKEGKPYKIIGAYDSETTNYVEYGVHIAFPILHQVGLLKNIDISQITSENVEEYTEISLFRNTVDLYSFFDALIDEYCYENFVPVICCHNLAFDMWGLSSWLSEKNVKVLAKSAKKPISFTILNEDNKPCFVVWDTLVFSGKSLEYMGEECSYKKLVGEWNYDLIRTPKTKLNKHEIAYAKHDIYSLVAWLGYFCKINPDIPSNYLAQKVVTKKSVVRNRRLLRYSKLKNKGAKKSVGQNWFLLNKLEKPKSDDELFTMIAATHGGFTFCSSKNASRVFSFDENSQKCICGYDATSQHPVQIVSHKYPQNFKKTICENMQLAFNLIQKTSISYILNNFEKPFNCAFYGAFTFKNFRPKKGSLYEKHGIYPISSARIKKYNKSEFVEDNQDAEEFKEYIQKNGYSDFAENYVSEFGKLVKADTVTLYLTELVAWEICQAYEWDEMAAHEGYLTLKFCRPSDLAVLSVMGFYSAKNEFKEARSNFYAGKEIKNAETLRKLNIPEFVINGMCEKSIDSQIVESTYLGLKADLNALFGIEACNEYKRNTILSENGIEYEGEQGICNAPRRSKTWYQMGQRIVGWSRIAQCLVMELLNPYVYNIINGDTDSIKICTDSKNLKYINKSLEHYSNSIDKAKSIVLSRVKHNFPKFYNPLENIGFYIQEFKCKNFCASWNKAYAYVENNKLVITLAGVPNTGLVLDIANKILKEKGFEYLCNNFLGYNVTYLSDITHLNTRAFPQWNDLYVNNIVDYKGNETLVAEPCVIALYPMSKTINDTSIFENYINMKIALQNNKDINIEPIMICKNGIIKTGEINA